jgi:hypothetical protein
MDAKAKLLEQKKQKSLKRQRKRDEDVHGKNKRARIGDGSGGKVKKPKSPDFLVKSFRLGAKPWNAAAVPPPLHLIAAICRRCDTFLRFLVLRDFGFTSIN